eukprot:GHVU01140749.1.p1 GENE.GHVU01140749.1~~GHVU01140749.1.p1  ORF type:complete len:211 (+),score=36.14 GHVU01140749.1:194-826(+)
MKERIFLSQSPFIRRWCFPLSPVTPRSPLAPSEVGNLYPFLLVNFKAGVSYHLVIRPGVAVRVGGSTIGGATFMSLSRLLCESVNDPEDAFRLALDGNNASIDMLVSDIYGGDYAEIGLEGNVIASSFGKLQPRYKDRSHRRRVESSRRSSSDDVESGSLPLANALEGGGGGGGGRAVGEGLDGLPNAGHSDNAAKVPPAAAGWLARSSS